MGGVGAHKPPNRIGVCLPALAVFHPKPPTPHPPHIDSNNCKHQKQYARAVVECDEFFLKFLEPFKKLKASDEAAAWEKAGTLQFKVCMCVCV